MSDPQPIASGRDLARQALAAYKASRPTGPATARPTKARRSRHTAGSGRDPVGFGSLLGQISAEQGWAVGVRGGSILDRWDELCPQYAGRVQAVAFDADRGRLDLRPASDAYATQLRLLAGQLARQINTKLGTDTVRAIRVLPVGRIDAPAPAVTEDEPTSALAPVRTRQDASSGYHRALAVHREHHRTHVDDAALAERIAAARARQDAALLARRLPDDEHTEYLAEQERLTKGRPVDDLAASIQAALHYKHHGDPRREPRQAFKIA
ncbi:DUF721 domain-containing protein (plasmid) [Streptomyces sp. QHH-9511]|uniref:DciA family protein n=1 Tax=Streptomyces sp. QHH-9511 TaxID=2684468 RepID=UPI001317694A|nr:DciA family protein [Streptomyces sp. QHH-9511]QGZ53399.1 DUF721 domain-containing protein [Streptomyces sp. QHH-9511]